MKERTGLGEWMSWKWENRPSPGVEWDLKQYPLRMIGWVRWHWQHRPRLRGKWDLKKYPLLMLSWMRWHWQHRPRFKVKTRGIQGHRVEAKKWIGWHWENRRSMMIVLILAATAGMGTLVFHRQLSDLAAAWKTERFEEEAEAAVAAGDWKEAKRAALESVQRGGSIESLRILVQAAREADDPNALDLATALFQHADATRADRTAVLTQTLDAGDVPRAGGLVQNIPAGEVEEDLDLRYQVVRALLAGGQIASAARMAEDERVGSRRAEFDLLLAKGVAKSGDLSNRPAVLNRIARSLQGPDRENALEAMRLINRLPQGWFPPRLAAAAIRRFESAPGLEVGDRLAVAYFRWRLGRLERELVVSATVADFRQDHLARLAQWLLRIGENERVADLTAPAGHPEGLPVPVFVGRMSALIALERYETLEAELQAPPAKLPKVELFAYRAGVAGRLGKGVEEVAHWRRAFEAAAFDPDKNGFYRLSKIAKATGAQDRQMEALAKAVEHRFGVLPEARSLKPLFAWLYKQGDTERLLRISYRLLRREPGNPDLINIYHYLRALHDQPDPEALKVLANLVEANPDRSDLRSSLAFVQLKTGNPTAALTTLDEFGSDSDQFDADARAVYAAALSALERKEEARALAAGIDWSKFPAEEGRLLRAMITPEERADSEEEEEAAREGLAAD